MFLLGISFFASEILRRNNFGAVTWFSELEINSAYKFRKNIGMFED